MLLSILPLALATLQDALAQTCPPNIDFEKGNFEGWTCYTGYTQAVGGRNEITLTAVPAEPGRHTMFTANSFAELDPYGKFPVICPNGSGHSIMLGNTSGGHEAEGVSYEFTIPAGQDDYRLVYHYAVVFQQPRHQEYEQPRMEIEVTNVTDNQVIRCASFTFIAFGSSLPGFRESEYIQDSIPVLYKDWTTVSVDLSGNAGKKIRLFFKSSDCTFNRHFGYAYIDIDSDCDGKITGAEYCPSDTAIQLVAPFGYERYQWYNQSQTNLLGNGQILHLEPPPPTNSIFAVRLFPYPGYGCDQTLFVKLSNTLSVKALAGPDTFICNQQSVRLGTLPKPGLTYHWQPAAGLSNPFSSNPFATPDKTTTYYLTVYSGGGGCNARDTVVVKASLLNNELQVAGKPMYCIDSGDSAILSVTPTDSIRWFKNNNLIAGVNLPQYRVTTSGTYYAMLRNKDGCQLATSSKAISINSIPVADFSLNNAAQCLTGNRFVFTNNSINAVGNMEYHWSLGDGMENRSQHPSYSYASAGKFNIRLIVRSSEVCADTSYAALEVYQNAVADFTIPPSCINLPIQINNLTADSMASPVNYQWTFNNSSTSQLRNPIPPVFSTAGSYQVSLSVNTNQCPTPLHTLTRTVTIEKPKPGINYPVKYALIDMPMRLQARKIGETVLWTPASFLDDATIFNPVFKSAREQQYEIKMSTASGCVTIDTQLVKTVKEVAIMVPTAFTPNHDGRNDYLRPVLFGTKELRYFKVFNRWGQLVFQTSEEGKGWDGFINGMAQATQTYVWMAEVLGADGELHQAKGSAVLIR